MLWLVSAVVSVFRTRIALQQTCPPSTCPNSIGLRSRSSRHNQAVVGSDSRHRHNQVRVQLITQAYKKEPAIPQHNTAEEVTSRLSLPIIPFVPFPAKLQPWAPRSRPTPRACPCAGSARLRRSSASRCSWSSPAVSPRFTSGRTRRQYGVASLYRIAERRCGGFRARCFSPRPLSRRRKRPAGRSTARASAGRRS